MNPIFECPKCEKKVPRQHLCFLSPGWCVECMDEGDLCFICGTDRDLSTYSKKYCVFCIKGKKYEKCTECGIRGRGNVCSICVEDSFSRRQNRSVPTSTKKIDLDPKKKTNKKQSFVPVSPGLRNNFVVVLRKMDKIFFEANEKVQQVSPSFTSFKATEEQTDQTDSGPPSKKRKMNETTPPPPTSSSSVEFRGHILSLRMKMNAKIGEALRKIAQVTQHFVDPCRAITPEHFQFCRSAVEDQLARKLVQWGQLARSFLSPSQAKILYKFQKGFKKCLGKWKELVASCEPKILNKSSSAAEVLLQTTLADLVILRKTLDGITEDENLLREESGRKSSTSSVVLKKTLSDYVGESEKRVSSTEEGLEKGSPTEEESASKTEGKLGENSRMEDEMVKTEEEPEKKDLEKSLLMGEELEKNSPMEEEKIEGESGEKSRTEEESDKNLPMEDEMEKNSPMEEEKIEGESEKEPEKKDLEKSLPMEEELEKNSPMEEEKIEGESGENSQTEEESDKNLPTEDETAKKTKERTQKDSPMEEDQPKEETVEKEEKEGNLRREELEKNFPPFPQNRDESLLKLLVVNEKGEIVV